MMIFLAQLNFNYYIYIHVYIYKFIVWSKKFLHFLIVNKIMLMKSILFWVYDKICNYNLFISDEDDYDDDESQDPSIELKYQKYSTRLYVLLLIGKFSFLQHIL